MWTVWRYEPDKRGALTKAPYVPGTTYKASHSRASTWRSFMAALTAYHERPDFFDGIEYCFAKDDPYIGGDIDHCINGGQNLPCRRKRCT
jgi:putative DNA primase/helicase